MSCHILIHTLIAFALLTPVRAAAKDCSLSKKFVLTKSQVLSGVFEDPTGAILPGVKVQLISEEKTHLLSEKRVVRGLTTDNSGHYDFGTVAPGKYRLRVEYSNKAFCAPEIRCRSGACTVDRTLKLNPRNFVLVE